MVQLDLNFKKLACELHAALYEPKNICCVSASAQEGDDISTTRGEYKHTRYKLVMSLSTRAHNMNALDTCHMRHQLECVFYL